MFARLLPLALLTAASAPQPVAAPAELAQSCAGRDGWSDPAPPARIHGSTWFVGTCGITALLIASPKGHILIDGATVEAAPIIAANIERLGLRMADVKLILASHEHLDHVGGLAELQRRSGAIVRASPAARPVLASGRNVPADPQFGAIGGFPPVRTGKPLRDGEVVQVGPIRLTAHFTPGHAPGGTSWTWRSCEARTCVRVAYADSLTAVSADAYRFTDHPERIAAVRASANRVAGLPCDLLVTPHPAASNLFPRLAGAAPLIDPSACSAYAARGRAAFAQRLARESGP